MKKAESQVRVMLADTILALCRNALPYRTNVCVEGLLGITMDDEEIFLININQTIRRDVTPNKEAAKRKSETENISDSGESDGSTHDEEGQSRRAKRKRRRRTKSKEDREDSQSVGSEVQNIQYSDDSRLLDEDGDASLDGRTSVKEEQYRNNDLVFVKQEPRDDSVFGHSQFPGLSQSDHTEAVSQLQQLAYQMSGGDLSSAATSALPVSNNMKHTSI